MNNISKLLALFFTVIAMLMSCKEETNSKDDPYLRVVTSKYDDALGGGDGFLLKIEANVQWTITVTDASGIPVDWIILDKTEGAGDACVFGTVKRGEISEERVCRICVSPLVSSIPNVVLELRQSEYIPVLISSNLANTIMLVSSEPVGSSTLLDDYTFLDVLVMAQTNTPNLPEDGSLIVTADGVYAKIICPDAAEYNKGDSLRIDLSGGKVTHVSSSGYTINVVAPASLRSRGNVLPDPIMISGTSIASYENALVKIGPCQVQDDYIGKEWNGISLFELTKERGTFQVSVADNLLFGIISGEQGYLTGYVVDGKLCPISSEDIDLSQPRKTEETPQKYYIIPIINKIHCTTANTISNATVINNNGIEFIDEEGWSVAGTSIIREEGANGQFACVAGASSLYQACFTTKAWDIGSSLTYKIHVNQKVYGDLEFGFSVNHGTASNLPWVWEVSWSVDGITWKPMSHVYSEYAVTESAAKGTTYVNSSNTHQNNRYCAEFNIPESEAVDSGYLYFRVKLTEAKIITSALTVRMNVGCYLATCVDDTPIGDSDDIIAMENFDACRSGLNHILGTSLGYLHVENVVNEYKSNYGFSSVGSLQAGRGYAWCKVADATKVYLVSPPLTKLKTDSEIKVSFKCALFEYNDGTRYEDHIGVSVTGAGNVGELVWDKPLTEDYFNWHTCTCTITGANSTTQVNIGNVSGAVNGSQFYIDDVIISR